VDTRGREHDGDRDGGRVGFFHLTDHRRGWGVAMDNTVDLPGYKCYVDPRTGRRPDVLVAFLNISPSVGDRVNGTLLEVSAGDLDELDRRERNYDRVDVSAALVPTVTGTVWAYVGKPEACERFASGLRAGRVVVGEDYHAAVRHAFAAAAPGGLAEFDELTVAAPCPIVALRRVDL
jgi:hypothetical protein